jgi:glycosyltransferase involved in cell wall biosynthesis
MKSLTLAIVIPVHNEESYLKACLDSIAAQTVQPDEVIVVNNNSNDSSVKLARSYPFVRILDESQQGIVHARNKGFNALKSDLIGRIDADTILPVNWVENAKYIMQPLPKGDAITGPCHFYDVATPRLLFAFHRLIYFWSSRLLFGHQILFGSNMVFYRDNWQRVYAETCKDTLLHEDMDLAAHIVNSGGHIRFINEFTAAISGRRFHNWGNYPIMWLKTSFRHGLFAQQPTVHTVNKTKEY